jgi:hypothetical protein
MQQTSFTCDAASRYPVTDFFQFQCRGILLVMAPGSPVVGSFYLFGSNVDSKWVEVFTPGLSVTPGGYFDNLVTEVESAFTLPGPTTPGMFKFTWQELNVYDGTLWTGTASGTWKNVTSSRGWNHPQLLSFTTTVVNPAH